MRFNDFPMLALLLFSVFIIAVGLIGSSNFNPTSDSTAAAAVEPQDDGVKIGSSSILAAIAAVLCIGVLIVAGIRQKGI